MSQTHLFVLLWIPTALWALPGFERTLKQLHPEMDVACTSCHDRPGNQVPSDKNVNKLGKAYYQEIMDSQIATRMPTNFRDTLKRIDFVFYGDSRSDISINKLVVKQICDLNPERVFHTGDLVEDGSKKSQWEALLPFHQCLLKERPLFFPSCGNHDGDFCLENPFREALGMKKAFYATEYRDFIFLSLDSYKITGQELQWLSSLPVGKQYVAYFHHPAYPTMAGHDADPAVLKEFVPRLKRLGVRLVFTGHNHGYDRGLVDGVTWISTGGGGAPLHPCGKKKSYSKSCVSTHHFVKCMAQKSKISCHAAQLDGSIIDAFDVDYSLTIRRGLVGQPDAPRRSKIRRK
jgi:acid phosphatase type 7